MASRPREGASVMSKLLLSSLFETVVAASIGGFFGIVGALFFQIDITWGANWIWLLISLPITFTFILTHKLIERN
tara:strand:- start:225 stop:449 length:225 start_codon:yes stop_codon:yes gene_type:complete